jgi:hypothetical protein
MLAGVNDVTNGIERVTRGREVNPSFEYVPTSAANRKLAGS